ncbi:KIR-like protein [Plasmodium coatneyi]|uniref:KIR-like protein n=1 Tax=Plasmodium coatneyi TaxID=208452 RepID=A0A1B1DWI1_9APIC|nr:KIR-like protein [Plasmodium coatneyi]ANQ07132.1 KIR-like protein [Plasmodium coatneyi]
MTKRPELDNLPSKTNYYDKFDQDNGNDCNGTRAKPEQLKTELNSKFKDCIKIIDDAKKIAKTYCYASTQNEQSIYENKEPCLFFYYWLGDKYWDDLKNNHRFSELLIAIHSTLKGDDHLEKCRIKYDNINETLLPQMKEVFDYYHDYKDVKDNILDIKEGCEGKWSTYLGQISSACKAVRNYCNQDQNKCGDYCTEFNNKYDVHCNTATMSKEKCELQSQLTTAKQRIVSEEKAASLAKEEAVRSATTTSSISSILGTLATIGAPFLLYKYKPWSSLFGNHSTGYGRSGRRKRRSSGQNFDVSAQDTFTEYSTENSTIGDSTTAENSTVRSMAHTRQSRGRTNNGPSHRNNVGYSRM